MDREEPKLQLTREPRPRDYPDQETYNAAHKEWEKNSLAHLQQSLKESAGTKVLQDEKDPFWELTRRRK